MVTFKLQAVLDHRQLLEDNLKKELAEIRQQGINLQTQLKRLEQKAMDTARTLKHDQEKGLPSDRVIVYHAFLNDLSDRMEKQKKRIHENREREADKQDELLEAMKNRQILDKLKARELDRHHQTLLRKERGFIDEIAVNQYVRKTLDNQGDEP